MAEKDAEKDLPQDGVQAKIASLNDQWDGMDRNPKKLSFFGLPDGQFDGLLEKMESYFSPSDLEEAESAAAAPSSNNILTSVRDHQQQQQQTERSQRVTKGFVEESIEVIFKRFKQGLQDLYNVKQRSPHADMVLKSFLAKSPDYLRDYIEQGLTRIENEAGVSSHNILLKSGQHNSDKNSAIVVGGASDAQVGHDSGSASSMTSGIGLPFRMTLTSVNSEAEVISSPTSCTLTLADEIAAQAASLDDINSRLDQMKKDISKK